MHASSNLPSMRTKIVGTTVTTLYVYTLWYYEIVMFIQNETNDMMLFIFLYFAHVPVV